MTLSATPATLPDAKAALAAASLPIDDLDRPALRLYAFQEEGTIVGYGGIEGCGTDVLLRSLVVLPAYRRRGFGSAIVTELVAIAAAGARCAYLLTTDAESYFRKLGFAEADRADAPAEIRATAQMAKLCPATAVLMRRSLP